MCRVEELELYSVVWHHGMGWSTVYEIETEACPGWHMITFRNSTKPHAYRPKQTVEILVTE